MSTFTDGAPPSVNPDPENDPDDPADNASAWLREEIQRRIAAGKSHAGGRHARRDSVDLSASVGYVPRHSESTPGPGAPRPRSFDPRAQPQGGGLRGPITPTSWSGPRYPAPGRGLIGPPGGNGPHPEPDERPDPGLRAVGPVGPTGPAVLVERPDAEPPPAVPADPADPLALVEQPERRPIPVERPAPDVPGANGKPAANPVAPPAAVVPPLRPRPLPGRAPEPQGPPAVASTPGMVRPPVPGDPVFTARTPAPGTREREAAAAALQVPAQRDAQDILVGDPDDPTDMQGKRVRVVLAERKGVARPVRTVVDIQDGTGAGEMLRSNLIGSQLAVALRFAVGAGLTLGVLPLVFYVFPEVGRFDVFGVRLPWLILGFLVYPFLLGLGLWHTRTAERVEQNFADHVQD